jgi:signal transduction histidine kinase/CheY-like chemotaxis protein
MIENYLPNFTKGATQVAFILPITGNARIALTILMGVLTVVIFVLDCLTPLGYSVWLLYFIPLMLSTSALRLNPYMLALVITILIVTGFFMSPPGVILSVSILNRSLGVLTIWITTAILARRIRAEEAVVNYRTLYESMDEGFCVIEMVYDQNCKPIDYCFIDINPAFEEQSGFKQALGKTIRQFDPNHEAHWFDVYAKVAKTGKAIRFENTAIGLNKYFDVFAYRIEGNGSKRVGVLFKDTTLNKASQDKLKNINTELLRAKTVAEKANLAKSDFLSHMSHELRTPLNAILGFAQLLETGIPSPTDIQAIRINQILKAGWYLINLINEILDLAMIESGKSSISLKQVSLSTILSECQSMLQPQAQKSDINLYFLLPDSTWYVHADQTKLKQVLINLLSNAIKYNRDNGNVEVWCSESTSGRLRITIKDGGSGLSKKKIDQLFQPFNRLGHEVGTKEGAGIGLAVSKKFVEMMGGTIGLESTVGIGSEFWIELDREVISQPTALIGFPDELVSQHKDDAACYTLLYVEDNPASLLLVEHIIGDYPYIRMLSALDGTQAIAIAREHLPDIILMDINLPGISGIETMTHLRKDSLTKHIPIIALSANAIQGDINDALEAGFSSYITKPIKNNELVEALDAAIASIGNEHGSAVIQ